MKSATNGHDRSAVCAMVARRPWIYITVATEREEVPL